MSNITIYSHDGSVIGHAEGRNDNSYVYPELEFNSVWMGVNYVIVTIKAPHPIQWHIGDYLLYRGEKFVLAYTPDVTKQARNDSYGEGFVYEDVKFQALSIELGDIRFLDVVMSDNNIHYTSLPVFTFYAETVEDYADRLQANANRYCKENNFEIVDYWLFITPNRQRVIQRARLTEESFGTNTLEARAIALYEEYYPDGEYENKKEKVKQNISISATNLWDNLTNLPNTFGFNFVTKGRALIIGAAAKINSHIFSYDNDGGLQKLERKADPDQQIVTKLYSYGSNQNMPPRYYANLNRKCFAKDGTFIEGSKTEEGVTTFFKGILFTNLEIFEDQFTERAVLDFAAPLDDFSKVWKCFVSMEARGHTPIREYVYVTPWYNTPAISDDFPPCLVIFQNPDDPNLDMVREFEAEGISVDFTFVFESGLVKDLWPEDYTIVYSDMPDNMAVTNLMLPGFPEVSLRTWVLANGGVLNQDNTITWKGYTAFFSDEALNPYILSPKYIENGVREGTKVFDNDEEENIYPSISLLNGLDLIVQGYKVEDNGVFVGEDEQIPNIKIRIPYLGFPVQYFLTDEAKISLIDGYCAGRDFSIVNAQQIIVDGHDYTELTIERVKDEDLDLYFPYSDNVAHYQPAIDNEPYQLRTGDKYVLLGISLPREYVDAAAEKLLEVSLNWISENDFSRSVYSPTIDHVFMAYQHRAVESGDVLTDVALRTKYGTVSLHDTMSAGEILQFVDSDLNIEGNVYITNLRILEFGEGGVPTYEITLRDEYEQTTLQKLERQIESISGKSGSGSGTSISQVRSIGDKRYLRRDQDDETAFDLKAKNLTATEKASATTVEATDKAVVDKLEVKKIDAEGTDPTSGDATIEGNLDVQETARVEDKLVLGKEVEDNDERPRMETQEARDSMTNGNGALITNKGRMQVQNLEVRGALTVMDLVYNQLHAMAGEYYFSEAGAIDTVTPLGNNNYRVRMRREYATQVLAFETGDILYSIANNLTSKSASEQGYYVHPSWMKATNVVQTSITQEQLEELGVDSIADLTTEQLRELEEGFYIDVQLYNDSTIGIVVGETNFPPEDGFNIVRRGNYQAQGDSTKKERARLWHISNSEGMISFMDYLYSPKVIDANYQTTIGKLPNVQVLKDWFDKFYNHDLPSDHVGVYTQFLFAENFVKIDWQGRVMTQQNPRGEWSLEVAQSGNPYRNLTFEQTIGGNKVVTVWQADTVTYQGCVWQCATDQTTNPPSWRQTDWILLEGNTNFSIEFVSSKGYSFRRGYVDTVITPHLFWGNIDITDDIATEYWNWTRESESGKTDADRNWDRNHTGLATNVKTLHLTDNEMPATWSTSDKAIFTCTVIVNDGKTTIIVENQIIS